MWRVIFHERLCPDCGERCDRFECACGYMRPHSDVFWIVPGGPRTITTTATGPWPRLNLPPLQALALAHRIIAWQNGMTPGDGWGGGVGGVPDGDGFGVGSGDGSGDGWGGGW